MKYLLDTHILMWTAAASHRLSPKATEILSDSRHALFFSSASIWELTIKYALKKPGFEIEPTFLRGQLIGHGFRELEIISRHALAVQRLPLLHKDPFDRLLAAQALVEDFTLLTADKTLARYPVPMQLV